MLKEFPSDKISSTKNALFFRSRAPTHHSFTFNFEEEAQDEAQGLSLSPKTDLVTNFLNQENRSFENVSFSTIKTFKQIFDIPLLNNPFISFLKLFISLIELKNIHSQHPLKKHRCKFKTDKITYSNCSPEQRMPTAKISLHCILYAKLYFLCCLFTAKTEILFCYISHSRKTPLKPENASENLTNII